MKRFLKNYCVQKTQNYKIQECQKGESTIFLKSYNKILKQL